jgi:Uncharacterised nucleotidyltransferase
MNLGSFTYGEKDNFEQRLIGALLKSDAQAALSILKTYGQQSQSIDRFLHELYWSNLPVLLYQRICELNLTEAMQPLLLSNGKSLLLAIREKVARATLDYQTMSDQFLRLVELIDQFITHVVWLKGTSLSRSLYQQGNHRLSLDFDLVVEEAYKDELLKCFEKNGFEPIWHEPGYCHQYGVGPVGSLYSLSLTPTLENETCHNLSLKKIGWPLIDFKLHPLDTGLVMKEQYRFFVEAEKINWSGITFLAPSVIDHLMVCLLHFHKHGFCGWGWLYDIHLLATKLNEKPEQWKEFVRRCQTEGIQTSASLGLRTAKYQLSAPVPKEVLKQLDTWQAKFLPASVMLRVSTEFVWNCNSLPMLLLNALVMGDGQRKLRVLLLSVVPSRQFISQYYAQGKSLSWHNYLFYLFLHWSLLLLPAGLIRRTYGKSIWKD